MPSQPDVRDVHVDAILTQFSLGYKNLDFVSDRVFPIVRVAKQSDKYFSYPKSFWFRDLAQLRAPATESVGSGYEVTTASYFADNYAFHMDIADEVRANADAPIQVERDAVNYVTGRLALKRERLWVSTYFRTGVWATDNTSAVDWSTYGTSDPIVDLEAAANTMRKTTGVRPNTLVLGADVWVQLKNHPDLIDRIKYTQKGLVSAELFSSVIDIPADRILVGSAIYDSSEEGGASVFSDLFGKHALLLYVDPNVSTMTPTAGLTFVWDKFGGGALQYMRRLRLDKIMADRIEGLSFFDQKLVASDLGYFFDNIVA